MRLVALPRPVIEVLQAHLDAFVADDPAALIFTGPSGRPMRRSDFNKSVNWKQAVAAPEDRISWGADEPNGPVE